MMALLIEPQGIEMSDEHRIHQAPLLLIEPQGIEIIL